MDESTKQSDVVSETFRSEPAPKVDEADDDSFT